MRAPLPTILPASLADYLPGRVVVVPASEWSVPPGERTPGVRTALPRYGLDLRTLDVSIDEQRVRWLTERATVRPLDARLVDVVHHRGMLHVVGGHHELAAHLITGAERIPVRLARARTIAPTAARATVPTSIPRIPPVVIDRPVATPA